LGRRTPPAIGRVHKSLSVRRDGVAGLVWWSLPLSLRQFCRCFAAELRTAEALVEPTHAVDVVDATLLRVGSDEEDVPFLDGSVDERGVVATRVSAPTRPMRAQVPSSTLVFADARGLLELADQGRVGPCRITLRQPDGDDVLSLEIPAQAHDRVQFCFLRPGDALRAVESLALGRRFGTDAEALERVLLDTVMPADGTAHRLHLVLEAGTARLESRSTDERTRTIHLHSEGGESGECETRDRWQVLQERWSEQRRRFPVNVILFAGLPLFIGFFRLSGVLLRRLRP